MDPLSQAVVGASLSQSFANSKSKQTIALIIGGLAGMAPDLDIFIRSKIDPMVFLEFHRQFTHSLIFIPIGALLCSVVFFLVIKSNWYKKKWPSATLSFSNIYLFSFLGYATHGLIDACTSYGTQLFWPFSDARVSWNVVSIIDPLLTFPVLILIFMGVYRHNARYAQVAFSYTLIFMSLGIIQQHRAETSAYQLAEQRGHNAKRVLVKPSFANRHVWKTIYEHDGKYYVDAVKLLWEKESILGTSIQKLNIQRDFPWLPAQSQQAKDIERFRWFSNDYLAISEQNPNIIMDVRYSFLPNNIKWKWGIEINPEDIKAKRFSTHVQYHMRNGPTKEATKQFIDMLF